MDDININIEYENAGETLPVRESAELYYKCKHIGKADDGWSEIVKGGDTYYAVSKGAPEDEGFIWMTPIKITGVEIYRS